MNLIRILSFLLLSMNIVSIKSLISPIKTKLLKIHTKSLKMEINSPTYSKTKSFLRLVRHQNIAPALLLSFSGAYITASNKAFPIKSIPSAIITVLVTCYSMVVNDIFDYGVDKINNPTRPLVSGEINIYEALTLMVVIIKLIDNISYYYLPLKLQRILEIMIVIVSIYTPILKRIPLVKNLTCASVVAFSVFFSGVSINNILLLIASNFLFFGSLMNELILDVIDYDGDKQNKIYTIPVLFGINNTLNLCNYILRFNILFNSIILLSQYNFNIAFPFFLFNISHYISFNRLIGCNYVTYTLTDIVNGSKIPLFLSLIYLCVLSKM